jgi:hypothetical protein
MSHKLSGFKCFGSAPLGREASWIEIYDEIYYGVELSLVAVGVLLLILFLIHFGETLTILLLG